MLPLIFLYLPKENTCSKKWKCSILNKEWIRRMYETVRKGQEIRRTV